ncbi:MAG: F0F1 ATP synthase subunit B [Flavobacteriales bacterium]|nr:F0F1 ATP synthase subunit B [Flavobacteriales bacterium]MCX7768300.1 F0F1 ATP synthase subunit B [Flavobacteriales bacterium]MDW8409928.1 F0F1 ATP synthase subunit B [Flavobacteriales bacterium]
MDQLVSPGIGLIFWTTLAFLVLLFLLKKFAWKPILKALKEREERISQALSAAEEAEKRLKEIQLRNESLVAEAAREREAILKAAREASEKMVAEAKEKAAAEAQRLLEQARENIHNERMKALTDLKNQVGMLSLEIAEKIMRLRLQDEALRDQAIRQLLDDIKLN